MSRHILITGAGSGIGKEIALAFARLGDRITAADIRPEPLAETARALAQAGATEVRTAEADLSRAETAEELIAETWEHSPIDVLISSAGIYPATPFLELTPETWDTVLDLNTRAPLLLTVALARRVIAESRSANVVNITSGAAQRARPGAAPYSTSKAALEMATRASALELGAHGIRVNAVSPGFITVDSEVNPVTEEYASAVGDNPLGRRGRPSDVARAVVWIASDAAEWITGEVLRVDGGSSTGSWKLPQHWESSQSEETS